MEKRLDPAVEQLIKGSEKLLEEVTGLESPESISSHLAESLAREARTREIESLDVLAGPQVDGRVELEVAADRMTVAATFFPPAADGSPLTLEAVQAVITEMRIQAEIDWKAIEDAVERCNLERAQVSDVTVARGTSPVEERPPYLKIESRLAEPRREGGDPDARVDFREISPFIMVKKGETLAALVQKQEGMTGLTVRGEPVPFRKAAVEYPKPKKNAEWLPGENRVVAACDGRFQSDGQTFWVDEVLQITGDVDFSVGNIDFAGDVTVAGEIREGFRVKAGGSLVCMKSIDASEISCGKDLITNQGIIGRGQAAIKAGGMVRAKFIENCLIEAVGPVCVQTGVMGASIRTLDRLEMGDKGIIVAGLINAQNGVFAAQIGTERGPRTEIRCGMDHTVEQKLVWIRDRNITLAIKLQQVENALKANPAAEPTLGPLRDKLKAAIHQLNESARSLIQGLDRNEGATVSVRETVYPGTYIEICHVSFLVTKPMRQVSFRLDKTSGKIVAGKWERKASG